MSIFEIDGCKEIGFQKFESLWNCITQWRQMFISFDSDSDGQVDAHDLGRALAHYGMRLGPTIFDLLVKKYASNPPSRNRGPHYGAPPPLQLDLDRFVCACIVVLQMYQLYEQMCRVYDHGLKYGAVQSHISRDDFLRAVISPP